jgi:hypothetical protein
MVVLNTVLSAAALASYTASIHAIYFLPDVVAEYKCKLRADDYITRDRSL